MQAELNIRLSPSSMASGNEVSGKRQEVGLLLTIGENWPW